MNFRANWLHSIKGHAEEAKMAITPIPTVFMYGDKPIRARIVGI